MGIDGHWSEFETWTENTRLRRPDCALVGIPISRFLGSFLVFGIFSMKKHMGAGWEVHSIFCSFADSFACFPCT